MLHPIRFLILAALAACPWRATAEPTPPEEPAAFLRRLCLALDAKDAAIIGRHVTLPLVFQHIVNENMGNPITEDRRLATAQAVIAAGLCLHLDLADARVQPTPQGADVVVPIGQFDRRFVLLREGTSFRLTRVQEPATPR